MRYNGISLAEIAGYDPYILREVIGRKRDQFGRLIRVGSDLPEGVEVDGNGQRIISWPTAFSNAFRNARRFHGINQETVAREWEALVKEDPNFQGI